jgi:O-antigen biosynthesis protein WbqP
MALSYAHGAKRALDLAATAVLALPVALVVACVALAIRLETPGPALFLQRRVGRNGREFTCVKLRTMRLDTPNLPSHQVGASAVTRLGHLLRRLKIDELPQLWNVARGEMSLVGPRPALPSQLELKDARQRLGVLDMVPGITGISQVAGIDMSDPQRLASSDARYVPSLSEDIRIIFATIAGQGRGDRVRG